MELARINLALDTELKLARLVWLIFTSPAGRRYRNPADHGHFVAVIDDLLHMIEKKGSPCVEFIQRTSPSGR